MIGHEKGGGYDRRILQLKRKLSKGPGRAYGLHEPAGETCTITNYFFLGLDDLSPLRKA